MRHISTAIAVLALTACGGDKGFVTFNNAPVVTILEPTAGTIHGVGDPIEFLGQVADDTSLEALDVEWASSIDGPLPDASAPDADGVVSYATSNLSGGIHLITLRAIDPENEAGEASVELEVVDSPDNPILTVTSPTPGANPPITGAAGIPFLFSANVYDADTPNEQLQVRLDSNPGGPVCEMLPDANGNAVCAGILEIGIYLLTFTVEDTEGFTSAVNVSFEVKDPLDADQDGDGFTPNGGDCDDNASTVFPGAPEVCDGRDNDCIPTTGIDVGTPCYDDDGDGFCEGPPCVNTSNTLPDCDDFSPDAFPGNPEICDGIDNDCLNGPDNGFNSLSYYPDNDSDGYGAQGSNGIIACTPVAGHVTNDDDCNDALASINPLAVENEVNGVDDNCNGFVDEGDSDFDNDGDGYCETPPCISASGTQPDCDDTNPAVYPGAVEVCGDNGLDNNCDGVSNEQNAAGCTDFFQDQDGDGYGTSASSACYCNPVFPFTGATSNDCDDNSSARNPGQTGYFTSPANGSYDYDCNGQEQRQFEQSGSPCQGSAGFTCNGTDGWITGVPACGDQGTRQEDCGFDLGTALLNCGGQCGVACLFGAGPDCLECLFLDCTAGVCDFDQDVMTQACR